MDEDFNWISAREAKRPTPERKTPKVDLAVSQILGKPVLVNDRRLINLVVAWKKRVGSSPDADKMDNFLYDPAFLVELRKTFA